MKRYDSFQFAIDPMDHTTTYTDKVNRYMGRSSLDAKNLVLGQVEGNINNSNQFGDYPVYPHLVIVVTEVIRESELIFDKNLELDYRIADQLTSCNKDYVLFFDTCGTHYVRGIERRVEVVTIFAYFTESRGKPAGDFETMLINAIRGDFNSDFDTSASARLNRNAASLGLLIAPYFFGFDPHIINELLLPPPGDFYEYHTMMEKALQVMTSSNVVGKVTGIDVVPWMSHAGFISLADLSSSATVDGTVISADLRKFYVMENYNMLNRVDAVLRNLIVRASLHKVCSNALGGMDATTTLLNSTCRSPDCATTTVQAVRDAVVGITAPFFSSLQKKYDDIRAFQNEYLSPCLADLYEILVHPHVRAGDTRENMSNLRPGHGLCYNENDVAAVDRIQTEHWSQMSGKCSISAKCSMMNSYYNPTAQDCELITASTTYSDYQDDKIYNY
eukprot:CAMPEP_0113320702 /NCGR_PEP_ID=MMETSP0010_2-20120614/14433_1 /TAXON_ID=216773 ORGANISM="Corethron hystrix, Strain 308" /NCGR_SAMPLE_ID=MMETSP0010_2 /ASSEMBLY_ACC=CAM_ASM_000155 /LENGTH=445 /DNA_ID=CAMNT_0000178593 /DNA_START=243 /DNA_END=1577 /DNA_ORIENTATION=- /assembly_acc=CAM_ASM_000155